MSSPAPCRSCPPGHCYTFEAMPPPPFLLCRLLTFSSRTTGVTASAVIQNRTTTNLPPQFAFQPVACVHSQDAETVLLPVFTALLLTAKSPASQPASLAVIHTQHTSSSQQVSSLRGNLQRKNAALHHHPFAPGGASSSNPFSQGGSSSRGGGPKPLRKLGAPPKQPLESGTQKAKTFCRLPGEVSQDFFEAYPELFPAHGALQVESVGAALFTKLESFNLIFELLLPADYSRNKPMYEEVDIMLSREMRSRQLHFARERLPLVSNPHPRGTPQWNAHNFEERLWTLHSTGNKPKGGSTVWRFPVVHDLPWYNFNLKHLSAGRLKPWDSPITPDQSVHFIYPLSAPFYGPIGGYVPQRSISLTDSHICYPLRVCGGLPGPFSGEDPTNTECFEICSYSQLYADGPPSTSNTPRAKDKGKEKQQPNAPGSSHDLPLFLPDDSDAESSSPNSPSRTPVSLPVTYVDNDDDLEEAIRLSLQDTAPPVAPRPQTPPNQTRPRSTEPGTPPASQRRRTSAPTPSPPAVAVRTRRNNFMNQQVSTTYSWLNAVQRILPHHSLNITGGSVEAMARTILGHIRELYGGLPWLPESIVDAGSIIAPEFDSRERVLLSTNPSWIVGNESSGEGVGRTVMDALMDLVFSDQLVWKDIGGQKVIQTQPSGVPLGGERLSNIRAYGYACMLYMLHSRALQQDSDLLNDNDYIRLAAPFQSKLLACWPANPAGFANNTNPDLAYLTGTYFERQPPDLTNLSPDEYAAYTAIIKRQVMYGTATPFSSSPEFKAFAETFNYLMIFFQTFGLSLKPLMIKMSASRLQNVDDLLSRIKWILTGVPAMADLERKYIAAFKRYLSAPGIVFHPLLSMEDLTPAEKASSPTDPLVRALMFLMTATGTQQLPPAKGTTIDMAFFRTLRDNANAPSIDVVNNPKHWPDALQSLR
ncbi:hypothetical protein C8R43DRAFT_941445 [Mycena crocata]|nr:hypothetical protein C8R43DRAFT_941445 [Mycena crocata]